MVTKTIDRYLNVDKTAPSKFGPTPLTLQKLVNEKRKFKCIKKLLLPTHQVAPGEDFLSLEVYSLKGQKGLEFTLRKAEIHSTISSK